MSEPLLQHEIPLARELVLLDLYTCIMQARFEERLEISSDIDPSLHNALVPQFTLQSLVENAIRHGVDTDTFRVKILLNAKLVSSAARLTRSRKNSTRPAFGVLAVPKWSILTVSQKFAPGSRRSKDPAERWRRTHLESAVPNKNSRRTRTVVASAFVTPEIPLVPTICSRYDKR